MTRKRPFVVFFFSIMSVFFAGCEALSYSRSSIQVVRSIEELQAQNPINFENGGYVKIGISTLTPYVGGGTYIYCLAKGITNDQQYGFFEYMDNGSETDNSAVIRFKIEPPINKSSSKSHYAKRSFLNSEQEIFFYLLILTPRSREYTLSLFGPDNSSIGKIMLNALEEAPHPWCPFYNDFIFLSVLPASPHNGILCPKSLPQLYLDDSVAENFAISARLDDGYIVFESSSKFVAYSLSFLCRWWVNGKKVIPPLTGDSPGIELCEICTISKNYEQRFYIPKTFNLKDGDIVTVQFMYCLGDWITAGRYDCPEGRSGDVDENTINIPAITNKITFVWNKTAQQAQPE